MRNIYETELKEVLIVDELEPANSSTVIKLTMTLAVGSGTYPHEEPAVFDFTKKEARNYFSVSALKEAHASHEMI